ncbi:MAG: hypothetical protein RI952_884 [Bacteroidota bacterium]|jgi:TolA-binding protein
MSQETENNIGEQFSKAEHYVAENRKSLLVIGGTIVALVLIYFSYQRFILTPREKEAAAQSYVAERYFEQDSLDKAINGDGNFLGFVGIIDEYGSTKAGNLAHYYLGFCYLKKGQYDSAVESLKEFSSNDDLLSALAYAGIADAYVELNQLDNASSYYAKSAAKSPNAFTAPIALLKLGITYEQLNENQKAVDTYNKIKKEFADTNEARDIDKYIARASAKI